MADVPVIDEVKLDSFGVQLASLFKTYATDRKDAEDRWLQNLRQFRGIYDPAIASMIPANKSRAYPKMTRWKVIGTVARLMQMLWPQTEKNYGIKASPLPNLSVPSLQEVLNTLVGLRAQAQSIPPRDVVLEIEEVEKAIFEYATKKAERMELKVDDDLQEMEFITLARKVVFSAVLYNIGVLKGPLATKSKASTWAKDTNTGMYVAKEIDKYKPLYEFLPVWNYYPDMGAVSLDKQDGEFEYQIMNREQVERLADRPDFLAPRIKSWLNEHSSGNHTPFHWETAMKAEKKSDRTSVGADADKRKYGVARWVGGATGHNLRAAGIEVKDEDIGRTFASDVWFIDNTVIKCKLAPLSDTKHHHVFVFEEDDLSLLGNGQCDTLRDSQLSICELARAMLDDASVCGTSVEVNTEKLAPGEDTTIRKHAVYHNESEGAAANVEAVHPIVIPSNLGDMLPVLMQFLDFANQESGLPPPSMGDVSGGGSEALRTQANASMFLGAAALPIRDTVRNYDTFTISVVSSLVAWNTKYDKNPSRDGDHNVIARGSTSLIAKEVQGAKLDAFRATITPDEMPHVKARGLLIERIKAHDLPVDMVLEDEAVAQETIKRQQDLQQRQIDSDMGLNQAKAAQAQTQSVLNIAKAKAEEGASGVDTFNAIVDSLAKGDKSKADMIKAEAAHAKSKAVA